MLSMYYKSYTQPDCRESHCVTDLSQIGKLLTTASNMARFADVWPAPPISSQILSLLPVWLSLSALNGLSLACISSGMNMAGDYPNRRWVREGLHTDKREC